jgi:AcrR family transcriptional regulator
VRTDRRWRERSLERALERQRRKSHSQSSAFVAAARELALQSGGLDFTVAQVVERAKGSLRGFYRNFAGKEELCLAVLEEMVQDSRERIEKRLARIDSPLERLDMVVRRLYVVERGGGSLTASISKEVHFLAANRPDDLRLSHEPIVELLEREVRSGIDAGAFPAQDARRTAISLLITITAHNQWRSDGVLGGSWPLVSADDLCALCRRLVAATGRTMSH